MSETLRPWLSMGCRQTGIAGNRLMCAGGTTKQHHTCCTVTYPAIYIFKNGTAQGSTAWRINSLLQGRIVLQMATNGFAHHGVFAHQHHSFATQEQTDALHLLGADIVCTHNEAFWIVIQELLQIASKYIN